MTFLDFPILGEQHFRQFHERLSRALAKCEAGSPCTFEENSTEAGLFFTVKRIGDDALEFMVAYKDEAVLASFLRFLLAATDGPDVVLSAKTRGKNAEYWTLHWPSEPRSLKPFARAYEFFLREMN